MPNVSKSCVKKQSYNMYIIVCIRLERKIKSACLTVKIFDVLALAYTSENLCYIYVQATNIDSNLFQNAHTPGNKG